MDLKQRIRNVPDFPKAGILFYDITTLLRDRDGFRTAVDMLSTPYESQDIDVVVGIESRGFILGAAVAERIHAGFIPIRKPGKLPSKALKETYDAACLQGYKPRRQHQTLKGVMVGGVSVPVDLVAVA